MQHCRERTDHSQCTMISACGEFSFLLFKSLVFTGDSWRSTSFSDFFKQRSSESELYCPTIGKFWSLILAHVQNCNPNWCNTIKPFLLPPMTKGMMKKLFHPSLICSVRGGRNGQDFSPLGSCLKVIPPKWNKQNVQNLTEECKC